MTGTEVLQQTINALSLGGTYALLALGLAMVFSIVRLINFAHGELVVAGGYTMWITTSHHVHWLLVIPAVLGVTSLAGILIYVIAFRPWRSGEEATFLLTSFALGFLGTSMSALAISPLPEPIYSPNWLFRVISIHGLHVPVLQITTTATTCVCLVVLGVFLKRSLLGTAMRGAADDASMVRFMGINVNAVIITAFGVSGLLAGVAALLLFSQAGAIDPSAGLTPLVKAFIAVVIGGLGSLGGAVLGGLLLGSSEVIFQATLPGSVLPFRDVFVLVLLLAVLFVFPEGLVRRRVDRA